MKGVLVLVAATVLVSCQTAEKKATGGPFLYQISKGGKHSYVLGTVHYGTSIGEVSAQIKPLHDRSKIHVYEMVYDLKVANNFFKTPSDPKLFLKSGIMLSARQKGEPSLPLKYKYKLIKLGIPKEVVNNMSNSHCDIVYYRKQMFSGKSMDMELIRNSHRLGIRPLQLDNEEIREQADDRDEEAGLEPVSRCRIIEDILEKPGELETNDRELDKMVQIYKRGLEKDFDDPSQGHALRTKFWLKQLLPMVRKGQAFITVGAYHLQGRDGLLNLFKQKGFRVRRLGY